MRPTSRILKHSNPLQLSNSRKIVDTRNRIIHSYDNLSDEIVWSIVMTHLPVLKAEIEQYLNE